jgi:ketosteroid isomerase-like protein
MGTNRSRIMNADQIRRFLEHYGQAISAVDLAEIARCWEVPALVLSDQGAIAVSDAGEIERFFAQAQAAYRSQGLVATQATLERAEKLGERLSSVDVRWSAMDKAGVEKSSERSHYILRLGDDGEPRIRVALTRNTEE